MYDFYTTSAETINMIKGQIYTFSSNINRQSFATGLRRVCLAVLTSTAQTRSSSLGWMAVTRPNSQQPRGKCSSTTKTKSPTATHLLSLVQRCLIVRVGRYSRNHLWQDRSANYTWHWRHRCLLLISRSSHCTSDLVEGTQAIKAELKIPCTLPGIAHICPFLWRPCTSWQYGPRYKAGTYNLH
jgi:hypothetical protein